jgi:hypothetical protein
VFSGRFKRSPQGEQMKITPEQIEEIKKWKAIADKNNLDIFELKMLCYHFGEIIKILNKTT